MKAEKRIEQELGEAAQRLNRAAAGTAVDEIIEPMDSSHADPLDEMRVSFAIKQHIPKTPFPGRRNKGRRLKVNRYIPKCALLPTYTFIQATPEPPVQRWCLRASGSGPS